MNKIKVKLSLTEFRALYGLYNAMTDAFDPQTDHERLLKAIGQELYVRLYQQYVNPFPPQSYTLKLNTSEAVGFLQLWQRIPLPKDSYRQLLIQNIINALDAIAKNRNAIKSLHDLHG
jgi:hypothetical protein